MPKLGAAAVGGLEPYSERTVTLVELACVNVGAKDRPRARVGITRSYSENRTSLVSGRTGKLSLLTYIPYRKD